MALKPCKECGREISTEATTCPHCGKTSPTSATTPMPLRIIIGGLWLVLLGYCFWPSEKTPEERAEAEAFARLMEAQVTCKEFVRGRLRAPSTADFATPAPVSLGRDRYRVTGTYDAQNAFGAMLRGRYVCDLRRAGDSWQLTSLVLK